MNWIFQSLIFLNLAADTGLNEDVGRITLIPTIGDRSSATIYIDLRTEQLLFDDYIFSLRCDNIDDNCYMFPLNIDLDKLFVESEETWSVGLYDFSRDTYTGSIDHCVAETSVYRTQVYYQGVNLATYYTSSGTIIAQEQLFGNLANYYINSVFCEL